LKVILTDWHIQVISTPIKVNGDGAYAADKLRQNKGKQRTTDAHGGTICGDFPIF
jgi:hypothetical protein